MSQYAIGGDEVFPAGSNRPTDSIAGLTFWRELGPSNIAGRTRALVVHPSASNVLYSGAVTGGVWKSTDSGTTWRSADGGSFALPTTAVTSLAVIPGSLPGFNDTLVAGTGEGFFVYDDFRGRGVYYSQDSGATWRQAAFPLLDPQLLNYINVVRVSPTNSQIVYIGTSRGAVQVNGQWSYGGSILRLDVRSPLVGIQLLASEALGGVTDLAVVPASGKDYLFAALGNHSPYVAALGLPFQASSVIRTTSDAKGATTFEELPLPPSGPLPTSTRTFPRIPVNEAGRIALAVKAGGTSVLALVSRKPPGAGEPVAGNVGLFGLLRCDLDASGATLPGTAGSPWTLVLYPYSDGSAVVCPTTGQNQPPLTPGCVVCLTANSRPECGVLSNTATLLRQGWYDNVLAVDPTCPDILWVGGVDVYRSTQAGAPGSWTRVGDWTVDGLPQYLHEDQHAIVFSADPARVYIGNDGGIFSSPNQNANCGSPSSPSWTARNVGYTTAQFYGGAVGPTGQPVVGGTQDNGMLRRSVSDSTWQRQRTLPGDAGKIVIDQATSTVYASSAAGAAEPIVIRSSEDSYYVNRAGGLNTSGDRFLFVPPIALDGSQVLYAGGTKLWRTADITVPAPTWSSTHPDTNQTLLDVSPNFISAISVYAKPGDPRTGQFLLVGTSNGTLHSSTDAGRSWRARQPAGAGQYCSAVAFDPHNPSSDYAAVPMYAAFSTFTTAGQLWLSRDAGSTWTSLVGQGTGRLPNAPVLCVLPDPVLATTYPGESAPRSSRIFLGTDIGILVSSNGGQTWMREFDGLPPVPVEELAMDAGVNAVGQLVPRLLYAWTHGRGAYQIELCLPKVVASPPQLFNQTDCAGPGTSLYGLYYWGSYGRAFPLTYANQYSRLKTVLGMDFSGSLVGGTGALSDPYCGAIYLPDAPQYESSSVAPTTIFAARSNTSVTPNAIGTNDLTLNFHSAYGREVSGPASLKVIRQGDLNLDSAVDLFDNLTMRSYIVGNVTPGTAPFLATLATAETASRWQDYNSVIDIFDVVRHSAHIVGNLGCLTPPQLNQTAPAGAGVVPSTSGIGRVSTAVGTPIGAIRTVPVTVNVTSAAVGKSKAGLFAYSLRVEFDPAALEFLDAAGGTSDGFGDAPTFTAPGAANKSGVVRVLGVATNGAGKTDLADVTVLRFREIAPDRVGGVRVIAEQLATPFIPGPDGTRDVFSIPVR